MATLLLFIMFFGLVLAVAAMRRELNALQQRVVELEEHVGDRVSEHSVSAPSPNPSISTAEPEPEYRVAAKATGRRVASVVSTSVAPPPLENIVAPAMSNPPATESVVNDFGPAPSRGASFESLMGAKLPIWVGGISLVFAAFFLVRYSIEAGLLGPVARSIIAAIFAFALIGLSEFGSRLPKIGDSFAADTRIAQSLAGAGVASLYATLYMASEIYGLVALPMSFFLAVAVTILAFILSLRRGPPTAIMGVIGGFAAPWVAGMGASSVPTLLLYLGVFVAAVFGLALWRRWLWLLLLASGGGTLWTLSLVFNADSALPLVGLFITLAGAGALFAIRRFGAVDGPVARVALYAPMALALLQLAMLLPRLEFSIYGWAQYGALAALSAFLARRDRSLFPLFAMAAVVAVIPLIAAWNTQGAVPHVLTATIGYALLFGIPGYLGALRDDRDARWWGMIGLFAPVAAYFISLGSASDSFGDTGWGALALAMAIPPAYLAYTRKAKDDMLLVVATATCALMATTALLFWIDDDWISSIFLGTAIGIFAWAKPTQSRGVALLGILPLTIGMLAAVAGSYKIIGALGTAALGYPGVISALPDFAELVRHSFVPSVLAIAIARAPIFAPGRKTAIAATGFGIAGLIACLWFLAKQPLSIDTPADFIRYGFFERMVITHILFTTAFAAIHFSGLRRNPGFWLKIGLALLVFAIMRIVYFDLLILNPLFRAQQLGPAPIANLGTLHMAATTIWLWLFARQNAVATRWPRAPKVLFYASLGSAIITALVTVRQLAQGTLISGARVQTGENYLYSAALLILSLAWLARGITGGAAVLRIAGLGLLTAVTFKVFLIDAAALTGILRILSFLGLGVALIGIGWAYGRLMKSAA